MDEIIYFELNNWAPSYNYPDAQPFLDWLCNDLHIQFEDEEWVKENKLCVAADLIDMSVNFCITSKKKWVLDNCPELLTKYTMFLREPGWKGRLNMSEVEVYGSLDGFEGDVGKPIYHNGRKIGVVERVDFANNTWHGIVFDHNDILKMVEEQKENEVEIAYDNNL